MHLIGNKIMPKLKGLIVLTMESLGFFIHWVDTRVESVLIKLYAFIWMKVIQNVKPEAEWLDI